MNQKRLFWRFLVCSIVPQNGFSGPYGAEAPFGALLFAMDKRRFTDPDGDCWEARVISTGNSSSYLNEKVQRPIVEFRSVGLPRSTRYAMLKKTMSDSLGELNESDLTKLFEMSKSH